MFNENDPLSRNVEDRRYGEELRVRDAMMNSLLRTPTPREGMIPIPTHQANPFLDALRDAIERGRITGANR